MTRSFTAGATLFVLGALTSGAFAATPVHNVPSTAQTRATPVNQVMSEKENKSPGLSAVLGASDGVIYDPPANDPRTHGLPNF